MHHRGRSPGTKRCGVICATIRSTNGWPSRSPSPPPTMIASRSSRFWAHARPKPSARAASSISRLRHAVAALERRRSRRRSSARSRPRFFHDPEEARLVAARDEPSRPPLHARPPRVRLDAAAAPARALRRLRGFTTMWPNSPGPPPLCPVVERRRPGSGRRRRRCRPRRRAGSRSGRPAPSLVLAQDPDADVVADRRLRAVRAPPTRVGPSSTRSEKPGTFAARSTAPARLGVHRPRAADARCPPRSAAVAGAGLERRADRAHDRVDHVRRAHRTCGVSTRDRCPRPLSPRSTTVWIFVSAEVDACRHRLGRHALRRHAHNRTRNRLDCRVPPSGPRGAQPRPAVRLHVAGDRARRARARHARRAVRRGRGSLRAGHRDRWGRPGRAGRVARQGWRSGSHA